MFLLRPRPSPLESLSSWRQRAGLQNGYRKYPRPKPSPDHRDPDWKPAATEAAWLSDNFQLPFELIHKHSLDYYNARLNASGTSDQRWILPFHPTSDSPYASGPVLCPNCLQDQPYLRLFWRMAFYTFCPLHGSVLIERCPDCGASMWPSTMPSRAHPNSFALSHCQRCGADLTTVASHPSLYPDNALDLWIHVEQNKVPSGYGHISSLGEFMDGIWVICQLMLRRQSHHIYSFLDLPSRLMNTSFPEAAKSQSIRSLPLLERDRLIKGVLWLLQDWPYRFVDVCRAAKITRKDFIANRILHPPWLEDAISEHLTLRKRGTTYGAVISAISSLENSAEKVTKTAVRHILGVTECRAADKVFEQRKHASSHELFLMCGHLEHALSLAPEARDQRATIIRDYLIFLLSVLSETSIEAVLVMSNAQVMSLTSHPAATLGSEVRRRLLTQRADQLNSLYGTVVRPNLVLENAPTDPWFVARNGGAMAGHSVRDRLAKIIRSKMSADLWNSVDAFRYSLSGNAPVGRRRSRSPYLGFQGELF